MMKQTKKTLAVLAAASAATVVNATPATFDASSFTGTLETGVGTAASVAGLIAAVSAGVMVWKKVSKYFNKAG
jgi:hypothetical protein